MKKKKKGFGQNNKRIAKHPLQQKQLQLLMKRKERDFGNNNKKRKLIRLVVQNLPSKPMLVRLI